jgi:hypothetical protein
VPAGRSRGRALIGERAGRGSLFSGERAETQNGDAQGQNAAIAHVLSSKRAGMKDDLSLLELGKARRARDLEARYG